MARLFFSSLLIMTIGFAFSVPANAAKLASVNGSLISDSDLSSALTGLNEGQKNVYLKDSYARRITLERLIDSEVLAQ